MAKSQLSLWRFCGFALHIIKNSLIRINLKTENQILRLVKSSRILALFVFNLFVRVWKAKIGNTVQLHNSVLCNSHLNDLIYFQLINHLDNLGRKSMIDFQQ